MAAGDEGDDNRETDSPENSLKEDLEAARDSVDEESPVPQIQNPLADIQPALPSFDTLVDIPSFQIPAMQLAETQKEIAQPTVDLSDWNDVAVDISALTAGIEFPTIELMQSLDSLPEFRINIPTISILGDLDEELVASTAATAISVSTSTPSYTPSANSPVARQPSEDQTERAAFSPETTESPEPTGDMLVNPTTLQHSFREIDGQGINPDFVGTAFSIGSLIASRYSELSESEQKFVAFTIGGTIAFGPAFLAWGFVGGIAVGGFGGGMTVRAEMARQGRKDRLEE